MTTTKRTKRGTKRVRWEYCLQFWEVCYDLNDDLIRMGNEGWEAVGYTKEDLAVTILFKRKK